MNILIATDLNQLENIKIKDNDRVIMVLDDLITKNIYAVHDRVGFDVIILAPHSYSTKTNISQYIEFMKKINMKSMYLVRNSDIVQNEINRIINVLGFSTSSVRDLRI